MQAASRRYQCTTAHSAAQLSFTREVLATRVSQVADAMSATEYGARFDSMLAKKSPRMPNLGSLGSNGGGAGLAIGGLVLEVRRLTPVPCTLSGRALRRPTPTMRAGAGSARSPPAPLHPRLMRLRSLARARRHPPAIGARARRDAPHSSS